MKKFTEEEIINIFQYCNESDCDDCYNCAARQDGKCAIPDLGAQVVQVINRQKAEIERLRLESETLVVQLKDAYPLTRVGFMPQL